MNDAPAMLRVASLERLVARALSLPGPARTCVHAGRRRLAVTLMDPATRLARIAQDAGFGR